MNNSREHIFTAIRAATDPRKPVDQIATNAAKLLENLTDRRPRFTDKSNLKRFIEKATSERVTATVEQVPIISHVPKVVADYLKETSNAASIALQPRQILKELDWGNTHFYHSISPNETVAVSVADLAIAETGSVIFLSSEDSPTLMHFLPLHHIILVQKHLIHRHLEDVFTFFGSDREDQPRNLTIVTGTSGTADIEAKNIRGAHGPRFMHLIIIG